MQITAKLQNLFYLFFETKDEKVKSYNLQKLIKLNQVHFHSLLISKVNTD